MRVLFCLAPANDFRRTSAQGSRQTVDLKALLARRVLAWSTIMRFRLTHQPVEDEGANPFRHVEVVGRQRQCSCFNHLTIAMQFFQQVRRDRPRRIQEEEHRRIGPFEHLREVGQPFRGLKGGGAGEGRRFQRGRLPGDKGPFRLRYSNSRRAARYSLAVFRDGVENVTKAQAGGSGYQAGGEGCIHRPVRKEWSTSRSSCL